MTIFELATASGKICPSIEWITAQALFIGRGEKAAQELIRDPSGGVANWQAPLALSFASIQPEATWAQQDPTTASIAKESSSPETHDSRAERSRPIHLK